MFTKQDLQGIEQLRRALQMYAETLPEKQAIEVAAVFPNWSPGTIYLKDQYIIYGADGNGDPILYKVAQGHTSQEDWPPDENPALYTCVSLSSGGHPIWSPPSGAHDAYNVGDVVSHQEQLWRSKIDGNTTEPGTDNRWWEIYMEV